jgi:F-type H+-transporting ATPase subunit b
MTTGVRSMEHTARDTRSEWSPAPVPTEHQMLDLTLDQVAMQSLSVAVPADAPIIILVQETTGESQEGTGVATAGEAAGGTQTETTAADHGGEEKGGMPQLAPSDFLPQLIWLAISFVLLLILMSRVALPRVSSVVELREKRIQSDIERADRVKAEADGAKAVYEKTLADARAKAQAELAATTQSIQAETGKRDAAFMAQLTQRTKAAEDAIAVAKTKALGDVRSVAAEAAASIISRIAGADAAAAEVASAVDAVSGRRG